MIRKDFMKYNLLLLSASLLLSACNEQTTYTSTTDIPVEGEMVAQLTSPPFVPAPVGNRKSTKLSVTLEIIEKEGELALVKAKIMKHTKKHAARVKTLTQDGKFIWPIYRYGKIVKLGSNSPEYDISLSDIKKYHDQYLLSKAVHDMLEE